MWVQLEEVTRKSEVSGNKDGRVTAVCLLNRISTCNVVLVADKMGLIRSSKEDNNTKALCPYQGNIHFSYLLCSCES